MIILNMLCKPCEDYDNFLFGINFAMSKVDNR